MGYAILAAVVVVVGIFAVGIVTFAQEHMAENNDDPRRR